MKKAIVFIVLLGLFVFAIFAILFSAVPRESQAIPPFARKYATACPTCHVVFPKLNAYAGPSGLMAIVYLWEKRCS